MKNSTDPIGNRTRDLLVCSAVPQPTVPPRRPSKRNAERYPKTYILCSSAVTVELHAVLHVLLK
jgi:hypothetical protein